MPIRSRGILCQVTNCNISVTSRKCDRILGCNILTDSSTENRVKSQYCYVSVTSRFVDLTRFSIDATRESWYDVDSARITCSRFVLAAVQHGFCGAAWGIIAPHEGNVRQIPHEGNVRQNILDLTPTRKLFKVIPS